MEQQQAYSRSLEDDRERDRDRDRDRDRQRDVEWDRPKQQPLYRDRPPFQRRPSWDEDRYASASAYRRPRPASPPPADSFSYNHNRPRWQSPPALTQPAYGGSSSSYVDRERDRDFRRSSGGVPPSSAAGRDENSARSVAASYFKERQTTSIPASQSIHIQRRDSRDSYKDAFERPPHVSPSKSWPIRRERSLSPPSWQTNARDRWRAPSSNGGAPAWNARKDRGHERSTVHSAPNGPVRPRSLSPPNHHQQAAGLRRSDSRREERLPPTGPRFFREREESAPAGPSDRGWPAHRGEREEWQAQQARSSDRDQGWPDRRPHSSSQQSPFQLPTANQQQRREYDTFPSPTASSAGGRPLQRSLPSPPGPPTSVIGKRSRPDDFSRSTRESDRGWASVRGRASTPALSDAAWSTGVASPSAHYDVGREAAPKPDSPTLAAKTEILDAIDVTPDSTIHSLPPDDSGPSARQPPPPRTADQALQADLSPDNTSATQRTYPSADDNGLSVAHVEASSRPRSKEDVQIKVEGQDLSLASRITVGPPDQLMHTSGRFPASEANRTGKMTRSASLDASRTGAGPRNTWPHSGRTLAERLSQPPTVETSKSAPDSQQSFPLTRSRTKSNPSPLVTHQSPVSSMMPAPVLTERAAATTPHLPIPAPTKSLLERIQPTSDVSPRSVRQSERLKSSTPFLAAGDTVPLSPTSRTTRASRTQATPQKSAKAPLQSLPETRPESDEGLQPDASLASKIETLPQDGADGAALNVSHTHSLASNDAATPAKPQAMEIEQEDNAANAQSKGAGPSIDDVVTPSSEAAGLGVRPGGAPAPARRSPENPLEEQRQHQQDLLPDASKPEAQPGIGLSRETPQLNDAEGVDSSMELDTGLAPAEEDGRESAAFANLLQSMIQAKKGGDDVDEQEAADLSFSIIAHNQALAPVELPLEVPRVHLGMDLFAVDDVSLFNHEKLEVELLDGFAARDEWRGQKIYRLREQYKEINGEWQVHCSKLEKIRSRQKKHQNNIQAPPATPSADTVASLSFAPAVPATPSLLAPTGRANRRNQASSLGYGDAARSEAEFLEILASLEDADMRDPNLRAMRTTATVPDMALHESEVYLLRSYDDQNGLVLDPFEHYGLNRNPDVWTEDEIATFCRRYALFPKQFGKIAAALPEKTTAQCVLFYYRSKKKIDFRALVDKRTINGRRKRKRGATDKEGDQDAANGDHASDKKKGTSLLANLKRSKDDDVDDGEDDLEDPQTPGSAIAAVSAATDAFVMPAAKALIQQLNGDIAPPKRPPGKLMLGGELSTSKPGNKKAARFLSPPSTASPADGGSFPPSDGAIAAAEALGALASLADVQAGGTAAAVLHKRPSSSSQSRKRRKHSPSDTVDRSAIAGELANPTGDEPRPAGSSTRRNKSHSSSYWSVADKNEFVRLLSIHGRNYHAISEGIESKTAVQCKNFYQNNVKKLGLADIAGAAEGADTLALSSAHPEEMAASGHVERKQRVNGHALHPAPGYFVPGEGPEGQRSEREQLGSSLSRGGMHLMNLLDDAPDAEGGASDPYRAPDERNADEDSATEDEEDPSRYASQPPARRRTSEYAMSEHARIPHYERGHPQHAHRHSQHHLEQYQAPYPLQNRHSHSQQQVQDAFYSPHRGLPMDPSLENPESQPYSAPYPHQHIPYARSVSASRSSHSPVHMMQSPHHQHQQVGRQLSPIQYTGLPSSERVRGYPTYEGPPPRAPGASASAITGRYVIPPPAQAQSGSSRHAAGRHSSSWSIYDHPQHEHEVHPGQSAPVAREYYGAQTLPHRERYEDYPGPPPPLASRSPSHSHSHSHSYTQGQSLGNSHGARFYSSSAQVGDVPMPRYGGLEKSGTLTGQRPNSASAYGQLGEGSDGSAPTAVSSRELRDTVGPESGASPAYYADITLPPVHHHHHHTSSARRTSGPPGSAGQSPSPYYDYHPNDRASR